MARRSKTTVNISLRNPGRNAKAFKEINAVLAGEREAVVRSRCIQAAYLARDTVADNAPNPMYSKILQGEKLERYYNKNPGYDVKMEAGAGFVFVLKLSTDRYSSLQYRGYNPVWGLIVSNYGRRAIDVQRPNAIPLPIDEAKSVYTWGGRWKETKNKPYNHPSFGTGYRGRYAGKFVHFVTHVDAVEGTNWIEDGLVNASTKINNVLSGATTYRPKGLVRGARGEKVWSFE